MYPDPRADAGAGVPVNGDDRHPGLVRLCAKLHDILIGRAAEDLLARSDQLPEVAGLWPAPTWMWVFSAIDVGRKDRGLDGTRMRLPGRLDWTAGPLTLVTTAVTHTWSCTSLGHSTTGTTVVSPSIDTDTTEVDENGAPTMARTPLRSREELVSDLNALVRAGVDAKWQSLTYLEPHVRQALRKAHASVSYEISTTPGQPTPVLDETKLEALADKMVLGDDTHPGKVHQLIDRCLRPGTFARVEPLKYIKESLRVDAHSEVRKALGDPHIGPKVRRVARAHPHASLEDLLATYRQMYPRDRLSTSRAVAALSVGPDAMAVWRELSPERETA